MFYPERLPAAKMLSYYWERLNGVELNGSFYMAPAERALRGWAAAAPSGFRFCLKGHRGLTYSGEGFDKVGLAGDFGRRVALLGDRLGPILVQFPPARQRDAAMLERILEALGVRAAVEFRHASWFSDDVYGVLRRHSAALVVTDEEKWPKAPTVKMSGLGYYRLRRDYSTADLKPWRDLIRSEAAGRDEVHVYFKHEPSGPARALFMLD